MTKVRIMPFYLGIAAVFFTIKGLGGSFNALFYSLGLETYHAPLVGLVFATLMMLFFLCHATSRYPSGQSFGKNSPTKIQLTVFLVLFALIVLAGLFQRIEAIHLYPIDIQRADMLPLIIDGFKDVSQGSSPYRTHVLSDGRVITHYYLPPLWVSFYTLHLLDVDIRYVNITGHLVFWLILLVLFMRHFKYRNWSFALSALCFLVLVSLFAFSKQNLRQVVDAHTGAYWITYILFLFSLALKSRKLTFISIPLLVTSREMAILLVLPYAIHLYRHHRKHFYEAFLWGLTLGSLILIPFILASPAGFFGALIHYIEHASVAPWKDMLNHYGLCGFLKKYDILFLQWPFQLSGLAIALWLSFRTPLKSSMEAVAMGGVIYMPFILFSSTSWGYIYTPPLILTYFLLQRNGIFDDTSDSFRSINK